MFQRFETKNFNTIYCLILFSFSYLLSSNFSVFCFLYIIIKMCSVSWDIFQLLCPLNSIRGSPHMIFWTVHRVSAHKEMEKSTREDLIPNFYLLGSSKGKSFFSDSNQITLFPTSYKVPSHTHTHHHSHHHCLHIVKWHKIFCKEESCTNAQKRHYRAPCIS